MDIPRWLEDEVVGLLSGQSLGAEFRPGPGDRGVLTVYLTSPEAASAAKRRLARALKHGAQTPELRRLRVDRVEDAGWVERYQASLEPFHLGSRFVVHPAGDGRPGRGRTPIRLVPGRAFGTGEHPTTRLCAEWLERLVRPGSTWLDLGCGSGILSIVASRCGAGRVTAVDMDPDAVTVAAEVLAANGLSSRVKLLQGSAAARLGTFDGLVANIAAPFFLSEGPSLSRLILEGGLLIASGFPSDAANEVRQVLGRNGLDEFTREVREAWCVLVLRRGS
jgi:ribosomal protein L11 methyltransferase